MSWKAEKDALPSIDEGVIDEEIETIDKRNIRTEVKFNSLHIYYK